MIVIISKIYPIYHFTLIYDQFSVTRTRSSIFQAPAGLIYAFHWSNLRKNQPLLLLLAKNKRLGTREEKTQWDCNWSHISIHNWTFLYNSSNECVISFHLLFIKSWTTNYWYSSIQIYHVRAIIIRSWFETALDYKPRIIGTHFLV